MTGLLEFLPFEMNNLTSGFDDVCRQVHACCVSTSYCWHRGLIIGPFYIKCQSEASVY